MIVSIADTHTAIWYLFNDQRLSPGARNAFESATASGNQVGISSISLAEVVYLTEKSRIPPTTLEKSLEVLRDPETVLTEVPFDSTVAEMMRLVPREDVPDLPDRIIAATALKYGVSVISRDAKIRVSKLQTVW